jgi:hypothetical protein
MGRQVQSFLLDGSQASSNTILCGIYDDRADGSAASSHRWPREPVCHSDPTCRPASPAQFFNLLCNTVKTRAAGEAGLHA